MKQVRRYKSARPPRSAVRSAAIRQNSSRSQLRSSVRLAAGGVLAGAAGTAAMDTLLYLRSRRAGLQEGPLDWEFSSGVTSWSDVSAPGLVGKRLLEGFMGRAVSDQRARSVQNAVHWGTGASWGTLLGLIVGPVAQPALIGGLVFGPIVWLSGYVLLPIGKIYKPMWDYDAKTLAKDLSAHMVYGVTAGTVLAAVTRRSLS
jgi:hypothetical protein